MKLDIDPSDFNCSNCSYLLDDKASDVFDNLVDLEDKILLETKMSLFHIAGYVTRHDDALGETELLDSTMFYYEKYGSYTKDLDRGGLKIPTDSKYF